MCKAKNDERGYKRCLVHNPGSQYNMRVVGWITGASKDMISSVMRTLNKEGKAMDLPEVSAAEASGYLQREMFVTENDQTLTAHERTIRRSQLARALDAVKNGISGAHFYVWKNLLPRVRSTMGRTIAAVGLSSVLAFGMSACSAGVPTNPTSSPTTTQSQSAAPTTTPSTSTPATAGQITGDTATSTGTIVKDGNGSYQTIKVADNADALKYNSKIVDAGATQRYSKTEIQAAQKFAVDFVVTQSIDSPAYDSASGWAAWKAKNADKYVAPGQEAILNNNADGGYPALIVTDKGGVNPVATRDGSPRESKVNVDVTKITGYDYQGQPYVSVSGVATATYRATDKELVRSILAGNPDKTETQLKAIKPDLFDGKDNNGYPLTFNFGLVLQQQKDGSYKIAGYKNEYHNTLFD